MSNLEKLLTYYEEIIDIEHHRSVIEQQKKTIKFEPCDKLSIRVPYTSDTFRPYSIEEIHNDMAKMMFNELLGCLSQIEAKDTSIPMIRVNYGVGTLPSAFGLKSMIINGNMPWVEHVSTDKIREIISKGVPDYRTGFGQKVIDTYEFYRETLAKYPKCNEVIKVYHPDYQGPLDVAHLIYGSDIYLDMYEDPDLVHELLGLVTETYIDRMKKIKPYLNDMCGTNCFHWSQLYPGPIVLRNDSAVNLSSDMYKEFAQQYDHKIMHSFGKFSMHFCGRADQWIFDMARSEDIIGLNFGHMPNLVFGMEFLDFLSPEYTTLKLPIMSYVLTKKDFETMDFERFRTCISYHMEVANRHEAEEYLARCKQ